MNSIFGNSLSMTERSLDYLWQKQTVIANNIANNDTPGFKSQYLTFEDTFKNRLQMAQGSAASMQNAIMENPITRHTTNSESTRLDGNNVQIEAEYIEQSRTILQYQYQIRSLTSNFTQLRTAIKGQ